MPHEVFGLQGSSDTKNAIPPGKFFMRWLGKVKVGCVAPFDSARNANGLGSFRCEVMTKRWLEFMR